MRALEREGIPPKLAFLPDAKALIFYKSLKAGFVLGAERGEGFVIAR